MVHQTIVRDAAAYVVAVVLLCLPAFWNGFPLMFDDVGGYLERWPTGTLGLGRSTVYGLLLWSTRSAAFIPVIVLQALVTTFVVDRAIRVFVGPGRPRWLLPSVIAAIATTSGVALFVSKVIPDAWAAPGVLALDLAWHAATYRLALLGIVTVALLLLYIVLYRTRVGMIVRAGIEDFVMVDALGIDVYKVFMLVFGIGAMAAGFAGIVNAPVVAISPDVGEAILVQTFVVVVIGGVGSFSGAVLGGLIAGEIISVTSMFNPGYAYVMLFAAMTLVLVIRPYGLLGTPGRE